jgi:hypothetical protein
MKKSFARLENFGNLPKRIVNRVLEMRPDLINEKWVDTEMASGQFTAEIESRVPNPSQQVWGFEEYKRMVKFAVNTRQLQGNYATITELGENMKFKVGIVNPWYGKRQWFESAQKLRNHLDDDGMMVLVAPDATQAKSAWGQKVRKFLEENGIQERWNATESFPTVNTGEIGVFFMDFKNIANMSCLDATSIEADILERMITLTTNVPSFSAVRGRQDIQYQAEQSNVKNKNYPVIALISVTNDQLEIKYVSKEYKKQQKGFNGGKKILINRYFGKNNPDPYYVIDDVTDMQLGYSVIAIDIPDFTNEISMMKLLTHPVYRKVLSYLKGGGMDIKQSHLELLPNFLLKDIENLDQFLNTQLNLSEEEIKYFYA